MANEDWSKMVGLYKKDEISSIQIIRQESRETVLVNALVYFLHPRRGGKWIKDKILDNLLKKANFPRKPKELLCIKTEFPCENGGRLDILLEFQNHCIGLEVKIDSDATNDFKNYRECVEKRANAGERSREVKNFLLVKERKKGRAIEKLGDEHEAKAIEKLGDEHEAKVGNWGVISWGELMKGCPEIVGDQEKSSGIVDLLETLKKIEINSLKKLEEFSEKEKLDESAKELEKFLQAQFSAKKIFIWDSVDDLRQIYEPRVVVEFHSPNDGIKVDICVGFRGAQFVVFNTHNSYDRPLYEKICKNYRFYYWQDYQDEIEHYNRYLLANKNLICEDGNGPILPNYDKFKCSAGEEDSILVKNDKEEVDFHEEILEKLVEIQENLVIR